MSLADRYDEALALVSKEVEKSDVTYEDFTSAHEMYGVLAEEVAEFFDAVRMPQSHPDRAKQLRSEAVQIAAIAMRIIEQADRVTR